MAAFVMRKNFTHAELINKHMMLLIEQGLVTLWDRPEKHWEFRMPENYKLCNNTPASIEPTYQPCISRNKSKSLSMDHLKSIFKVYSFGLGLAVVAFIAEIIWHQEKNRFSR